MSESTLELSAEEIQRDEELVRRLEAGDPTAVEGVMDCYRHYIFALHVKRFRTEEVARILTADTVYRLVRYLKKPALLRWGSRSLIALLNRVAARSASAYVKGQKLEDKRREKLVLFTVDPPPQADAAVMAKELSAVVRAAIAELPPRLRTVATMFFLEQRTKREIAALTDTQLKTVDEDVRRAQKRLVTILRPYWKGTAHV